MQRRSVLVELHVAHGRRVDYEWMRHQLPGFEPDRSARPSPRPRPHYRVAGGASAPDVWSVRGTVDEAMIDSLRQHPDVADVQELPSGPEFDL